MASTNDTADRYRRMAEEVRAAARTITYEETRATMLRLANAYEEAAIKLEQESNGPTAPRD
jgi:hypothetical protein